MRNFVRELVTNRFGIVLATLNLCYLAARVASGWPFPYKGFDKVMIVLNAPALFLGVPPMATMQFLLEPSTFRFFEPAFIAVFFIFSVTLQWLFIAWAARKIAQKLSKTSQ